MKQPNKYYLKGNTIELVSDKLINSAQDVADLSSRLKQSIQEKKKAKRMSSIEQLFNTIKNK